MCYSYFFLHGFVYIVDFNQYQKKGLIGFERFERLFLHVNIDNTQ